jgi:hypothetical protein
MVLGPSTNIPLLDQHTLTMTHKQPPAIPKELNHLIYLNVEHRVLICPDDKCRKAVRPSAFVEHLRVQHKTPLSDRRRVQEYVGTFGGDCDYSTIELPPDKSRPQPMILIFDGFQCRLCPTRPSDASTHRPSTSTSKKCMKVHGNKKHKRYRVLNNKLFKRVRLQSWF